MINYYYKERGLKEKSNIFENFLMKILCLVFQPESKFKKNRTTSKRKNFYWSKFSVMLNGLHVQHSP